MQKSDLEWIDPTPIQSYSAGTGSSSNWFNPYMNYDFFMVPGILAFLANDGGRHTCLLEYCKRKKGSRNYRADQCHPHQKISGLPRKTHFLFGSLGLSFSGIGLFFWFRDLVWNSASGSIFLLYGPFWRYTRSPLGLGLLIFHLPSDTTEQAMSVAFFIMMIFLLMSGLFTPIDSIARTGHKWSPTPIPLNLFHRSHADGKC